MEPSSTLPIMPTTLTLTAAELQQREFATLSTLLNVLTDFSLFVVPGFRGLSCDHPSPEETIVAGYDAYHKVLKTLRALSFVLIRDHEIIALLSQVLPTGVVGFLSVTVPRWTWPSETQTIHVAQNSCTGYDLAFPQVSQNFHLLTVKQRSEPRLRPQDNQSLLV